MSEGAARMVATIFQLFFLPSCACDALIYPVCRVVRCCRYTMGEAIRSAGLRAVKQQLCSKWAEVVAFLDDLNPQPFKYVATASQNVSGGCVGKRSLLLSRQL